MKSIQFSQLLPVLLAVIGLSVGQILFKLAAAQMSSPREALKSVVSGWMLVALIVYAIATLLWVYALRTLPLRVAYPFAALAYLLVPLLAHFFLSEPLQVRTLIGAAIIMLGILVSVT
jgi:drug/metabolite transporter (DMT)-like permease